MRYHVVATDTDYPLFRCIRQHKLHNYQLWFLGQYLELWIKHSSPLCAILPLEWRQEYMARNILYTNAIVLLLNSLLAKMVPPVENALQVGNVLCGMEMNGNVDQSQMEGSAVPSLRQIRFYLLYR